MVWISRTFFVVVVATLCAKTSHAQGSDLTGRLAPDMRFETGMNGVERGTTLSSFRGRVVWVKFVLRDCPRCRVTLPRAQRLHDRWGGSGLVVLVVVRGFGPAAMRPFMDKGGYDFRLGTDAEGAFGARYGVRTMPTDYVIDVDGRVKASNGAPEAVLLTELGRYRLARLGPVPDSVASVRDAVWRWDYGTALRTTEAAVAAGETDDDVRIFAARVAAQAREELDARLVLAAKRAAEGKADVARSILDRVVGNFRETSLSEVAVEARRRFLEDARRR